MPRMTNAQKEAAAAANFALLPRACVAEHPTDASPVFLLRGGRGFYTVTGNAAGFNERNGITTAQVKAMLAGSMFGWHAPAANPRTYAESTSEEG